MHIGLKLGLCLGLCISLATLGAWVITSSTSPPPPAVSPTITHTDDAAGQAAQVVLLPYAWFHDTAGAFKARINQIAAHKHAMAQIPVTNLVELKLWRDELDSMRHSCRVIAAHYNANAAGANPHFFTSPAVPPLLIIEGCDT